MYWTGPTLQGKVHGGAASALQAEADLVGHTAGTASRSAGGVISAYLFCVSALRMSHVCFFVCLSACTYEILYILCMYACIEDEYHVMYFNAMQGKLTQYHARQCV